MKSSAAETQRASAPKHVLVALVGGSGAGKSWLAGKLEEALHPNAMRLSLDDFYRDRAHLPAERRARINFDHPRAIDWDCFEQALLSLGSGRPAQVPCYDFASHCRAPGLRCVHPKRIVLVDGLWLLRRPSIRRLFAFSIYLDCPARTRLKRRLVRDQSARGRTLSSIRRQFREAVEPMHRRYVAPQVRHADVRLSICAAQEVSRLADFLGRLNGIK